MSMFEVLISKDGKLQIEAHGYTIHESGALQFYKGQEHNFDMYLSIASGGWLVVQQTQEEKK